jgi:hypothetical protein
MSARTILIAVAAALMTTGAASAQPEISNGRVESVAVARDLAQEIAALAGPATGPFWVGYAEPVVDRERLICCFPPGPSSSRIDLASGQVCCAGCGLEPGAAERTPAPADARGSRPVPLEGSATFVVLARVEAGRVERIRMFSEDCPLDAGGRMVYWLTGVSPAASLDWLAAFATGSDERASAALAAVALHRDARADDVLDRLVRSDQPEKVRERAAFWMGSARGRRGFATLRRLVGTDPADGFRRRAVFAISRSDEPEVVDTLIGLGRSDASPRVRGEALFWLAEKRDARVGPALLAALASDPDDGVQKRAVMALSRMPDDAGVPPLLEAARDGRTARIRGEALFWLAQKAGTHAAGAIADAIERDPDTDVKKRAVFALSQLPNDEGVPRLIEVARTNRNPEVRKQAMFWLGQSKDPRALKFFEEILGK